MYATRLEVAWNVLHVIPSTQPSRPKSCDWACQSTLWCWGRVTDVCRADESGVRGWVRKCCGGWGGEGEADLRGITAAGKEQTTESDRSSFRESNVW